MTETTTTEVASGCPRQSAQSGILIEEYLSYLGDKKNRSALTLDSYRNDLTQFAVFLAEADDIGMLDVDADIAAGYIDKLVGQYTPSTLGRKITALRGLYGYMITAKRLAENPFAGVHIGQTGSTNLEYLEEAHLQQLFETVSGSHWLAFRDRAIIAVLYSTGMRVGELLNLCIDDIDTENAAVYIRTPGRTTRLCRMAPWAWHAIQRYLGRRPMTDAVESSGPEAVFVNRDGNRLTARSVRRKLTDYGRRAGLPVEATPAVLRHSCAVHMLRRGADVKTVRDMLGHLSASSIRPYLNCLSQKTNQHEEKTEALQTAAS